MYYLYNKKGKHEDQNASSSSGRTVSTAPMTVHSSGHSSRRHLHPPPQPIIEEGNGSSTSLDVPEGLDSSHPSHQPPQRRRPEPDDSESKQKEEQVVRRLLRRRGLEEHDFTEEVMQPRRPNRIRCQRCNHDIGSNDNQHRIFCSDRERHVFCKTCFVNYVEVWVEGSVHYELRVGKQGGAGRGLHALPCMNPVCQKGCLQETSMQALLPPTLFMSCRQKLARVRSELQRSKPRGTASSDQPPQRRNVARHDSPPHDQPMSRPRKPQMQQQNPPQLYEQDHLFQQQQNQLFQEHERHQQELRQQGLHTDPYQQYQHSQPGSHLHQQGNQYQQQHHQHHQPAAHAAAPLPLPTALRRTSTTSSCGASQKTQKTSKSVRFSLAGDEDNLSTGSSTSSLTTRYPVNLDDHQKAEKEEANRRYRQMQLREQQLQQKLQQEEQYMKKQSLSSQHMSSNSMGLQQQQQQQQQQQHAIKNANLTTCQCCYEEIAHQASSIVSCGQRHPGVESHRFCAKCVRLYVEEWVFGAAAYTLRPGATDSQGETSLVLPCLHGDCTEGGFPDDQVGQALSPRSMEQYLSKINPMRIQKQDDEERLVQMAIRLSLEQEEIKRRVARLHEEQRSVTQGDAMLQQQPYGRGGHLPLAAVNVPETNLSTTSSLTSFNTLINGYSRSLPDMPSRGTLDMKKLAAKLEESSSKVSAEDQHSRNCERSVHEVEEAMTLAKVRKCPNCNTKFLKDEDFCNKLKCPSCRTAICYICRQVIPTQGYEHFCIHKQGGCADCLGQKCPLWTQVDDDNQRDMEEMRARGMDEANRIWEESLLTQTEIRVDVDSLLQQPSQASASASPPTDR